MILDFLGGSDGLAAAAGGAGVEDCGVAPNSGAEPEDCLCCMDDNGRDVGGPKGGGDWAGGGSLSSPLIGWLEVCGGAY